MKNRITMWLCVALTACSSRATTAPTTRDQGTIQSADACKGIDDQLRESARVSREGYAARALAAAERADNACPSQKTRLALAVALADLGLDARAIEAYGRYGAAGNKADASAAAEASDRLRQRPPATRKATAEERRRALLFYRDGVNLRLQGKFDGAIRQFRKSYARWPHPLTIVQIGLAHKAAGHETEYRRANARALALAEYTRGAAAVPRIRTGHLSEILALKFSPAGRTIASASGDGMIAIWDVASGRQIRSMGTVAENIVDIAFNADGTLIAASGDHFLKLFDVASGQRLHKIEPTTRWFKDVALSPDGRLVAAVTGRKVHVWDVTEDKRLRRLKPGSTVYALGFLANGELATVGAEKIVRIWDATTGAQLRTIDLESSPRTPTIRNGTLLFASKSGLTRIELTTGATRQTRTPSRTNIGRLSLSADGSTVVGQMGDALGALELDETASFERIGTHTRIRSVDVSPDGRFAAASGKDPVVKLWNIAERREVRTLQGDGVLVFRAALSPDARHLATVGGKISVLWDLTGEAGTRQLPGVEEFTWAVAFSPDGARLATSTDDSVRLWNANTGSLIGALPRRGGAKAVIFDPDDRYLAVASRVGVSLFDLDAGKKLREIKDVGRTHALDISGDGALLATTTSSSKVGILDLRTGERVVELRGHDKDIWAAVFNADATELVTCSLDNTVRVWDVITGAELRQIKGHDGTVADLAFDPTRPVLASAGWDHSVKLWSFPENKLLRTMSGHDNFAMSVSFGGKGLLATGGLDWSVRLWDARTGAPLARLMATTKGDWLVISADGRVAGSAGVSGEKSPLFWQIGDVQLPGFVGWQRQHTPKLLGTLTAPYIGTPPGPKKRAKGTGNAPIRNGRRERWFLNGNKRDSGQFVNGLEDGAWTYWFHNGNKAEQVTFRRGAKHGPSALWHPNGTKKEKGRFVDGEKTGQWTGYFPNGKTKQKSSYDDGALHGVQTRWDDSGTKRAEQTYVDGKREGRWREWYANGKRRFEGTYRRGKKEGRWLYWREDGRKEKEEVYKKGGLELTRRFDTKGKPYKGKPYKGPMHRKK